MCEFSVYYARDLSQKIAQDIVKARMKDGNLFLSKILGETQMLENAFILEVDVSKERMVLSQTPMAANLFKLIELNSEYEKKPSIQMLAKIVELWKRVKDQGDTIVKTLKARAPASD